MGKRNERECGWLLAKAVKVRFEQNRGSLWRFYTGQVGKLGTWPEFLSDDVAATEAALIGIRNLTANYAKEYRWKLNGFRFDCTIERISK